MSARKRRMAAAVETVEQRILLSAISGRVYSDVNQNGQPDPGEPSLSAWTVYLDQNNNGVFDQNLATTQVPSTDVPKNIPDAPSFTVPGSVESSINVSNIPNAITHLTMTFDITHTSDSDLQLILISPAGTQAVVVDQVFDQNGNGQNFTNTTLDDSAPQVIDEGTAPFTGTFRPDSPLSAYNGESPNGTWTLHIADVAPGDTGTLNSWSLQFTTGEASTRSDSSGNYTFANLAAGAYHVREIVKSGFTQTSPPGGVHNVTLDGTNTVTGQDFGNFIPPGTISGTKFNDLNNNGVRDPGEPALSGWTIYIDTNNNGQLDAGEPSTVTDSSGHYSLQAPIEGSYHIREVLQPGWTQSKPGSELNVGQNVNISREPGNQSEGAIAINPTNPSQMFMMSNEDGSVNALSMAYSTDGGATWTTRVGAYGPDLPAACCDPSVSWDSFGNLFMSYIDESDNNIVVADSTDGGKTFSLLNEYFGQANEVDQPTTVTGPGVVWVTWNDFGSMSAIGASVTGLGSIGGFSPLESVPGAQGSFGDIAVGPAGQLMEVYQDNTGGSGPSNIYVSVDPDGLGPQGFSDPTLVTTTNVGGFDFIPPQSSRSVDAETGLAWDRTGGPHNGRVYLVYTDEIPNTGSGNTDLFLRHSDDNGATWSAPIRVNDDATTNAQFLPRIAIDQTTGDIALSWYDCRNDQGNGGSGDTDGVPNTDAQVYATASLDGGQTVLANVRVSSGTVNAADSMNGIDLGDYIGLAFQSGRFFPLWADNSNSTLDNPDGSLSALDQYTAAISLATPPNGAGYSVVAGPGDSVSGIDFGNHQAAIVASVVGRSLFYNNSHWDGNTPGAGTQDDAAIATDKQALQPGQTASFANISSYSRGINGIVVDVANAAGTIAAGDFTFLMGNNSTPSSWAAAPAPLSVTPRSGPNGSTRVEIVWADRVIQNTWLQVTVKADANTGLSSADVFYFGSLIGESGDAGSSLAVTSADEQAARNDPHSFLHPATITNAHDYNRDGRVDAIDQILARNNAGASLVSLAPLASAAVVRRPAAPRVISRAASTQSSSVTLASSALAAARTDLNGDGKIDFADLLLAAQNLLHPRSHAAAVHTPAAPHVTPSARHRRTKVRSTLHRW